jgi:hypothetical protein
MNNAPKTPLSEKDNLLLSIPSILTLAKQTGKIDDNESQFIIDQVKANKNPQAALDFIKKKKIKPENIDKKYSSSAYSQYIKPSADQIENSVPGGMKELGRVWPEMYQMKFLEKNGRMPAVLPK